MVGGGEVAAHQSSRNEGNVSGIAVISGDGRWSLGDLDLRQFDGCGLCQQAGRNGVPLPLTLRPSRCELSSMAVQCSGRSPQPAGSGYRDRVVFPPAGGESSASSLGLTVN